MLECEQGRAGVVVNGQVYSPNVEVGTSVLWVQKPERLALIPSLLGLHTVVIFPSIFQKHLNYFEVTSIAAWIAFYR